MNERRTNDGDIALGPGCERHRGDPHNLCEACWKLEPDSNESGKKIENAESGILGCDAVWPYDPNAAYFGMKEWAELLLAAYQRLEKENAELHRAVAEMTTNA